MDEIREWFYEIRIQETVKNLVRHGFEALKVPDRSTACNEMLKRIPPEKTVGVGGSVTVREIDILRETEKAGKHPV